MNDQTQQHGGTHVMMADFFVVRLFPKMKVRRDGVFEQMDQEIADEEDPRRPRQGGVEVVDGEPGVRPEGVDEPAVLPPDVDDQGLAGRQAGVDPQGPDVDPLAGQRLRREPAEDVVADLAADRRADAEPGEGHRRVTGAAADVQDQLVGLDQLPGGRQVVDRRAEVIGHDHPGADDL